MRVQPPLCRPVSSTPWRPPRHVGASWNTRAAAPRRSAASRDADVAEAASISLTLRELDPSHPAILRIGEGIQRLKADERRPAEAQLGHAVERGDDAVIADLAREMLARWPTSEPARSALADLEARHRATEAGRLAAEAWAAWSRGDAAQAGSLARRARALGVQDPEMSAWLVEAEAAVAEVAENAAIEGAIEDADNNRFDRYFALSAEGRGRVRERAARPSLAWLEAMGRTPEAVAAVLAFEGALANPVDALVRLRAHDRSLRTLPEARRFLAGLEAEADEAAKRRFLGQLDEAEDAYLRGELDRALALTALLEPRAGSPVDVARHRDLVANLTADRTVVAAERRVEERVATGDLLGARDLARASGLARLAASLAERVRRDWRVRTLPGATLRDASWPETDPYPRVNLSADGRQICIGEAHAGEVFVRIIDRATMTVERALRVRTPSPLSWRADQLIDGRLYVIGSRGAVLAVDVEKMDVVLWRPDVLEPDHSIELSTMAPGGRYLWLTVRDGVGGTECRVYDLESWPRFRTMGVAGRPFPLWGAAEPTVALLQPGLGLRLHTPSGNARMQRVILADIPVTRVTAEPTGHGIFGTADATHLHRRPGSARVLAPLVNVPPTRCSCLCATSGRACFPPWASPARARLIPTPSRPRSPRSASGCGSAGTTPQSCVRSPLTPRAKWSRRQAKPSPETPCSCRTPPGSTSLRPVVPLTGSRSSRSLSRPPRRTKRAPRLSTSRSRRTSRAGRDAAPDWVRIHIGERRILFGLCIGRCGKHGGVVRIPVHRGFVLHGGRGLLGMHSARRQRSDFNH